MQNDPGYARDVRFAISPRRHIVVPERVRRIARWDSEHDSQAGKRCRGGSRRLTPSLFWSPDSRFIAFDAAGQVKKIDVRGGAPQKVCDLPTLAVGGAWNRDDVIIVGTPNRGLMRCSGGPASVVTQPDPSRGESAHLLPSFCLTAVIFLLERFEKCTGDDRRLRAALDAKPEESHLPSRPDHGLWATYVPDVAPGIGRLLFVRDGRCSRSRSMRGNCSLRRCRPRRRARWLVSGRAFFSPRPAVSSSSEGRMRPPAHVVRPWSKILGPRERTRSIPRR